MIITDIISLEKQGEEAHEMPTLNPSTPDSLQLQGSLRVLKLFLLPVYQYTSQY